MSANNDRGPAGRVLMVGLPGASLDPATRRRLETLRPGGVILFARNLETPEALGDLLDDLRDLLPEPTLLAVDQEGGRVSRLAPWIGPTPAAAALAAAGDTAAWRFGQATGGVLRALGFNLDFAPVVDLCAAEATNGIADRSFGTDPLATTRLAAAFLEALQGEGVAGCLKHFPGLGDTAVDSHRELPTCGRDAQRLEADDLRPYRELGPRAAAVMVGHAVYPALETGASHPASLSPVVVDRLLRGRLGYRGLVVSDDLEMGAVAPLDRDGAAAVAAVGAGCDLVLYCSDLDAAERAVDSLERAADQNTSFADRLSHAARNVVQTAARWPARRTDLGAWQGARETMRHASLLPDPP